MTTDPGKRIGDKLYLHVSALSGLDDVLLTRIVAAEQLAGIHREEHYNLVRIDDAGSEICLLHYPDFFDDAFPSLRERWLIQLDEGAVHYRTWIDSLNPPILHRKELMLLDDHPQRSAFAELTATAETVGLFDDPRRIGYRRQWLQLVHERGYRIEGHQLLPLGNEEAERSDAEGPLQVQWGAERQRTAMVRYGFSAPVQMLARHGFLDGRHSLFDYGCGRGDDLRGLRENGICANGWDPFYAPDEPVLEADLVNLGFVVNVIEDFHERVETIIRAWSLARLLLVVSVMPANQNDPRGTHFCDGVMTQRGTFQKYYTQAEIRSFLYEAIGEEPIPVAPGVLYVFRNKDAEQRFLMDRHRSRRRVVHLREASLRPQARKPRARRDRAGEQYEAHRPLLDGLWQLRLELGRPPDPSECEDALALVEAFGSVPKALRFVEVRRRLDEGEAEITAQLDAARRQRADDLRVYFALSQFERRKPYTHLEAGLKRDLRHFFGDYQTATQAGRELLMQIADVDAIEAACRKASERGLGWLEETRDPDGSIRVRSLQLDSRLVERLPALLRVYVGAAAAAYGDVGSADLIKVHVGSGKLTAMRFDDFDGQPLPRLLERVKIKLRVQDVEIYTYGDEYPSPFLYRKSRFISEEHPLYPEQSAFDEAIEGIELFDLAGFGPPANELQATMRRYRWEIDGFSLRRSNGPAELDDPCGRFLHFRDFIECGETQAKTGLPNMPRQPQSYNALLELAENILDPVIDWFGMIHLTYGFCSPELARKIPGAIDPKRDQHAAHETNRLGNLVCPRQGAAVDFIVEDEDMKEVALWIAQNTPFDRIYFYGSNKPLHVSYGPEHSRQIVAMCPAANGRTVPRVIRHEVLASWQ